MTRSVVPDVPDVPGLPQASVAPRASGAPRPSVASVAAAHRQLTSRVRLEWGPVGATAVGVASDRARDGAYDVPVTAVVVDVLSFTTTLSVAADRGVPVHPHPWHGSAQALADRLGATLAVGRSAAGPGEVSLSPGTVRAATGLERLVLPSPNGSTIAHLLAGSGAPVVGTCLRNRAAVARALAVGLEAGGTVALVPAGERWPDGSLRPAVEDLWGAGGVVAALLADAVVTPAEVSEEARAAAAAYEIVAGRLLEALSACASGTELVEAGYAADVAVAAELDASTSVPVLGADGAFVAAR